MHGAVQGWQADLLEARMRQRMEAKRAVELQKKHGIAVSTVSGSHGMLSSCKDGKQTRSRGKDGAKNKSVQWPFKRNTQLR